MRVVVPAVSASIVLLVGCGYVGPVMPPSPQLPMAVGDLSAVQRGDKLLIDFRTPSRTTDSLGIKRFSEIDLRIGPAVTPFDFDRWAATAKQYSLPPPPPNDPEDPQVMLLSEAIPVAEWQGQRVAIAVRTAIKKSDHYSSWSNRVVLDVIPALEQPDVKTPISTAEGVALAWREQSADHYRILRQDPGAKAPVEIGTSDKPSYLDTTAQFDAPYQYTIVAVQGRAESLPSQPASITAIDKFPPSVPVGVTALSGPDTVELSWQRSPESDVQGYYVFRSVNDSPFARQGAIVTLPTYSDRTVEHGKTYRYQVSAVDKNGNESVKSTAAAVSF